MDFALPDCLIFSMSDQAVCKSLSDVAKKGE